MTDVKMQCVRMCVCVCVGSAGGPTGLIGASRSGLIPILVTNTCRCSVNVIHETKQQQTDGTDFPFSGFLYLRFGVLTTHFCFCRLEQSVIIYAITIYERDKKRWLRHPSIRRPTEYRCTEIWLKRLSGLQD